MKKFLAVLLAAVLVVSTSVVGLANNVSLENDFSSFFSSLSPYCVSPGNYHFPMSTFGVEGSSYYQNASNFLSKFNDPSVTSIVFFNLYPISFIFILFIFLILLL